MTAPKRAPLLKIEAGIAIPKKRCGAAPSKYPFASMGIGDSFFIPCEAGSERRARTSVSGLGNSRHHPKRFTSRVVDGGVRVWRTE